MVVVLICLVVTVTVLSELSGDDDGPPACVVEDRCGRAVLDARRHPLVTVEADQFGVESRLVSGQVVCPDCLGALRPWGWARPGGVRWVASEGSLMLLVAVGMRSDGRQTGWKVLALDPWWTGWSFLSSARMLSAEVGCTGVFGGLVVSGIGCRADC